jgi:hypothetical protein
MHEELYGTVHGQRQLDSWEGRLPDHSRSSVPDQPAMRVDFLASLRTRTRLDRRIVGEMVNDQRTTDIARKFGKSKARISQLLRVSPGLGALYGRVEQGSSKRNGPGRTSTRPVVASGP